MGDADATEKRDTPPDRQARAQERIATVVQAVAIAAAIVLIVATLGDLVMIVFAVVLTAVMLRGAAARVGHLGHIGAGWGLLAVVVLLVAFFGGLGWWFGPALAHQATQLQETIAQQLSSLRSGMEETDWGRTLLRDLPFGLGADHGAPTSANGGIGSSLPHLAGLVAGALWSVLGLLGTVGLILVASLYMAAAPAPYLHGLVRLLPRKHRPEARRVMDHVGRALWGWLVGQFCDMLVVGVLCYAGLLLLGAPLPFILALIAALGNFVPYIGAIAGAVPAVLIALSVSPQEALYVALLYLGVQTFEGNVTAPLIQRRAIDLPPSLTLLSQTALGLVFGLFGVILATPFTAAVIATVQTLTNDDPDY